MTLALRSPELVHDIIAVDNAPVDAALESDFARYIQGMKKIEEAGVTRQAEADEILKDYEEALLVRQFLLGNLYRPSSGSPQKFRVPLSILGKALDHMGDFPYKDPSEVQFKKPALFVRGTRSKYVPDEVIPIIGQFFPKFELADVEAGHWVTSENPEAFRDGESVLSCYSDLHRAHKTHTNNHLAIAVLRFLRREEN
jgi:pimeloyl-ACP methyl ester carboxylesterase